MHTQPSMLQQLGIFLSVLAGRPPGQVVIQFSDACNATCPQCELRRTVSFKRSKVSMDDARRIIDAAAANGVKALSITGGEPFLYEKEVLDLVWHASAAGIPFTRTGTNGFMFMHSGRAGWKEKIHRFAEAVANSGLYTFWISIDSAEPLVHEEMRGLNGVIRGIGRALPIFHEHGIYPAANLGINRNTGGRWSDASGPRGPEGYYDFFRSSFARFYRFVIDMGFTITNACYPMSAERSLDARIEAVYGASSEDFLVRFEPWQKAAIFEALMDTIPCFRGKIRIFTPRCAVFSLTRFYRSGGEHAPYPCRGGFDYFFIGAQCGDTFPCGFRGEENLGKYWELDTRSLKDAPRCQNCDWECFRDPSELLGPFLELSRHPLKLARQFYNDRTHLRLWLEDILYYRACSFFSGRVAPDYSKMQRFMREQGSETSDDEISSMAAGQNGEGLDESKRENQRTNQTVTVSGNSPDARFG